jgi:hypothetical protein
LPHAPFLRKTIDIVPDPMFYMSIERRALQQIISRRIRLCEVLNRRAIGLELPNLEKK